MTLTNEQAKLGQEIVRASREFGGYLADILDDLPRDLVGLLAGDPIKLLRARRLSEGWEKVKKHLRDRKIENPEPPSLKLALPILSSMADENSEELKDLWERLLAAAMDPNRKTLVRQSLIAVVKQMDPFDVLVLKTLATISGKMTPSGRDYIMRSLESSEDEVLVSFQNLERLNCIGFGEMPKINPHLVSLGKILMKAVA